MKKDKKINKLTDEKQKQYENQAMSQWGEDRVRQSTQRWNSCGDKKKEQIMEECNSIFQELADNMQHGVDSHVIQELLIKWHQFIQYFYEPSLEVLRGLGDIYSYDSEFRKVFETIDPKLPDFLHSSINCYVDELEMIWLESQYEVLQE
ncbi:TipAS antibiotic-recognition domain-containing protein [Fusibacter bizertensis]|uniref:TipAS antibiotic-recognition domain-containing protein n=1 Tax=Fusibacter bizertensis TaxID=1488331 RepID=A0ABT6NFA0_9FIRM|nr:TipAS antibiotic-recognition domain-containing protein [Fusibacter bizertensis]MDH8679101.1 TipAS antibiotic-recognition domain-containing protein [Fusibacter bizertensis]